MEEELKAARKHEEGGEITRDDKLFYINACQLQMKGRTLTVKFVYLLSLCLNPSGGSVHVTRPSPVCS